MGRPKIKGFWEEAIRTLTENEPRLGPLAIHKRFEKRYEAVVQKTGTHPGPIPGLRTIGRIQQRLRDLPDKERLRYRQFRWPEDMVNGLLPWEAGASALELLRYRREQKFGRPLLGQVRWFFRVSTLAPDAGFDDRYEAARYLFAFEAAGTSPIGEDMWRAIEMWLAFTPWRSSTDAKAYEAALWGTVPPFPHGLWPPVPDFGGDAGAFADFLVAFDPFGLPEESIRGAVEQYIQSMNSGVEGGSQCEDTSADVEQNGQPSSASGTTKAADGSNSGLAASRPRRPRRKN